MSNNQKIRLEWNDFETNIRNSFKGLREEQDYFDVTLACDDGYQDLSQNTLCVKTAQQFCRLLSFTP